MHQILFQSGFLTIYSYGFFVALAFLCGVSFSIWRLKNSGLYSDKMWDLALLIMVSAVVGARVFYVIEFWDQYVDRPLEVFMVWKGGLVYLGGLTFALLFTALFLRLNKMPFWAVLDCITPGTILGYGIGRLGCFMNGCCYGAEASVPWAVIFPEIALARHPTQLYAMALALVTFLFLWWLSSRKKFDGQVFVCGLIYYSGYRFLIEFLRVNPRYLLGLSAAQIIAIILFIIAISLWVFLSQRAKWKKSLFPQKNQASG